MLIMQILRSPRTAFIFMAFIVAMGIVFGHRWFGWLGVGFVGLLGLFISQRAEMFADCGDPHERASAQVAGLYARQLENNKLDNTDGQNRRQGESLQRHILHRVINTIFAAILMLGGSMYFLKEF
jgi:hypothetical protein